MARIPLPSITSNIPRDLKRFTDRAREAFDYLAGQVDDARTITESKPTNIVGMYANTNPAASTNYTVGFADPPHSDDRVRIQVFCHDTAATYTVDFGSLTFAYSLNPGQSMDVVANGIPGVATPVTVQTDTPGAGFSAAVSIATTFE